MANAASASSGLSGVSYDLKDLLGLKGASDLLRLSSRSTSRSIVAGQHYSKIRGRGMTFAESRPYQPGDDVRQIDWRVTARTGHTHTKVFEEEKERPVFLIMDFNHTMFFGSRHAFKHVVAAEAAALIGWACVARGDHIGSLLITPRSHEELKPSGGRRGLMRLFHALLKAQEHRHEEEEVSLNDAFGRVIKVARPGSLMVVFSDFYHLSEETEQQLVKLRQHNDVVLCQVMDPLETQAPPPGVYPISDGKSFSVLNLMGASAPRLDSELDDRQKRVQQLAMKHQLAYGKLLTDQPVINQLNALWQ